MLHASRRGCALFAAVLALASVTTTGLVAQATKRPVDHSDYDKWPSIRGSELSPDGAWVAYAVNPSRGDGVLHIEQLDGETSYKVDRGASPTFAADSKHVVLTIRKSEELERQQKIEKLHAKKGEKKDDDKDEKEDENEDKLAILDLATGDIEIIEDVKSHRVDRDGKFLVLHLEAPKPKKEEKKDAKEEGESKGEEKSEEKKAEPETPAATRGAGGRRGAGAGRRGGRRGAMRGGARAAAGDDDDEKDDKGGTALVIRSLTDGSEQRFEGIQSYSFIAKDAWLCLSAKYRAPKKDAKKEAADEGSEESGEKAPAEAKATEAKAAEAAPTGRILADGLHALQMGRDRVVALVEGAGSYGNFSTDRRNQRLAFSSDVVEQLAKDAKDKAIKAAKKAHEAAVKAAEKAKEAAPAKPAILVEAEDADEDDEPRRDIYLWSFDDRPAIRLITHAAKGLPHDTLIQSSVSFSDDGSVITFGIKDGPKPDLPKILDEEKVAVDIWHWQDGEIQPMQARSANRRRNPTKTCVWHIDDGRLVVLGDEKLPSARLINRDGSRAIASDSTAHARLMTWDGRYSDYYLVNTIDGSRKLILEQSRTGVEASPTGRWLMNFGPDYEWHAIDAESLESKNLTGHIPVQFENELEDRPQPASAYRIAGWSEGDEHVFIYDRWDIWKIAVESGEAVCMTDGYGRANKVTLRNANFDLEGDDDDQDPMLREYLPETMLLTAHDHATKASGYFLDSTTKQQKPKKLIMVDAALGRPTRAKNVDRVILTKQTTRDFPDIWVTDTTFAKLERQTDVCAIQKEVRWGSSELVTWLNDDGVEMQGILTKPDGFDPTKNYPMMVYFYERNADGLHRYRAPSPGTSPNQAYYVSNGYLWFVPDIIYTVGYPGESAEKCIISGIQSLLAKGFVDRNAIGCAGHSWGGYQTAHLVTRTNLFAAAESGAPVSNMFSAYGGIRYQSGMSRQFQYEKTQSRIGGTPWQYPQRYWQNSPIFYADRVETPVLILHNDDDGAVPWTNGIEFFMALRRLDKEAYLFNYNGEPHGLRKRANQKDWTRRMAQFFDHHLRGAPAPKWMREGVDYIDREREKIPHAESFIEANAAGKIEAEAVEAVLGGDPEQR